MNFVFFGTPEFAAIILKKLIDAKISPALVICNPDRPVGRKKVITPPPVKRLIMNYESGIRDKIKILQPEKLDPSLFIIPNSSFDIFIVAAYAKIIPEKILAIPKLGTIGIHPSLLPCHRGATPIQTAILTGDEVTGVTLYLLDQKVDHGPVLAMRELEIQNSNFEILNRKLAELGAELLVEILPEFLRGEIKPEEQNEKEATFTKKFKIEDAFVDLNKDDPVIIERKVRALNPEPGVFTLSQSKGGLRRMKILEAEIIDGKLKLKKIQIEGKKPFDVTQGKPLSV